MERVDGKMIKPSNQIKSNIQANWSNPNLTDGAKEIRHTHTKVTAWRSIPYGDRSSSRRLRANDGTQQQWTRRAADMWPHHDGSVGFSVSLGSHWNSDQSSKTTTQKPRINDFWQDFRSPDPTHGRLLWPVLWQRRSEAPERRWGTVSRCCHVQMFDTLISLRTDVLTELMDLLNVQSLARGNSGATGL